MNRGELNWLLQTIKNADTAERFVLAQYEHGRISLRVIAHVARERGWINRTTNQFLARCGASFNRLRKNGFTGKE